MREQSFIPVEYPYLPTEPCVIGNRQILCAKFYNECWNAPFPYIPRPKKKVELRGQTYQEGIISEK